LGGTGLLRWYTALDTMRVAKRRMRGKDKEMNAGSKKPTERNGWWKTGELWRWRKGHKK
jgi:hypothetical protein